MKIQSRFRDYPKPKKDFLSENEYLLKAAVAGALTGSLFSIAPPIGQFAVTLCLALFLWGRRSQKRDLAIFRREVYRRLRDYAGYLRLPVEVMREPLSATNSLNPRLRAPGCTRPGCTPGPPRGCGSASTGGTLRTRPSSPTRSATTSRSASRVIFRRVRRTGGRPRSFAG